MTTPLTLDLLTASLRERDAAFRVRTRLQPAGGPGDKLFPPTYAVSHGSPYAMESRRVGGECVPCVLLDSVASQANRMEQALRAAWEEERLAGLPMILVDFREDKLIGLQELTVLDAPHRIADALLRDSFLGQTPFRFTPAGEALTLATHLDVSALFRWSPTSLLFGVWDSTGPRGGLGIKFPRAITSEIVGIHAVPGVKTASRLDPAGIEIKAAKLLVAKGGPEEEPGGWVLDTSRSTGKEVTAGTKGDKGKPSAVNHGNIAPSLDKDAGGVTVDYAEQITVLSLAALRRLRFASDGEGQAVPRGERGALNLAARAALAALGLAAIGLGRDEGYFLRSRCHLVPDGAWALERVGANGEVRGTYTLDSDAACALVEEAAARVRALGLGWNPEPVVLRPAAKLVTLIRKSQEIARLEA